MIKHCQYYVNWANLAHTNVANISACYSTSMINFVKENGSEVKGQTVINAVEPEQAKLTANMRQARKAANMKHEVVDESEQDMPSWISDDSDLTEHVELMVAVLNGRFKKMICWHCNKPDHLMTECFLWRDGKPLTADSRFSKMKNNDSDRFGKKMLHRIT